MKILRHCYLLVALLLAAGLGSARAQSFQWAKLARTDLDTAYVTRTSATDASGNTYVYTQYSNILMVGSTALNGQLRQSAAMIKYSSAGTVLWAKNLQNIYITQLAADNVTGGVFMAAARISLTGGATWDGVALPSGLSSEFYAKCSDTGALQWTQPLPSIYVFNTNDFNVVSDDSGNAYLSGMMTANGTIGNTAVNANYSFVCKINGTGNVQWVQSLHGASNSFISSFRLGQKPGGGFVMSGRFQGTLYQGAGTGTPLLTTTQPNYDNFIGSFDAAGIYQWSTLVTGLNGATSSTVINALAADSNGNCYATGNASGGIQLGTVVLPGGFFLAKYDATGALQWGRGQQVSNIGNFSDAGTLLAATTQGVTVVVQAQYPSTAPLTVGTLPLPSFYNFVHYNAQGLAQWAVGDNPRYVSGVSPIPPYFQANSIGLDAQGNLYAVGSSIPRQNRFGANPLPTVQFGAQTVVGRGTIITRLNAYANTLRGQVYYDQNGNGQQDLTEGLVPQQLTAVLTQGSATIYSNVGTDGLLQAYAGPGAYTLALAQVPRYHTISQPGSGSYSGTFSGSNQLVSGQSFGVAPIANQADVRITLTPYNASRPGFTTSYHVLVENMGTTTVSGTATVLLDSHFTYVSSTPSATRTGQTLTWTYNNLAPFARLSYDILLSLPTNAVVGTALSSTATAPLTGDAEPTDNTSTLAQTVVSSYDPNSMEVNYERITPTQVAAEQWLEYTIHFQNLGTAAATNVLLSDTLDFQKLNPATLQWITQSHNCSWSLTSIGPNTGLLTVRFLGINLPERNVDVIRSMGFVRFRVRARPTLAVGEIIPNHAGIVFDYNSPVLTNTATTTVFVVTAALGRHDAPAWTAYPNPATDAITVAADLATAGAVRVELLDVLGRPVRQQTFTAPAGPLNQALNLYGLAAGVYVLRLTPPTGPATSRQVVIN